MIKSLLLSSLMIAAPTIAAERPNVLVIMADDLGYNDFGFQGSEIFETPHLDAIAKNGIISKVAHTAASVCSPPRAGFITGRYQQRFGHEANCPPNGIGMDNTELTMWQAFQSLGYSSYSVEKWHLENFQDNTLPREDSMSSMHSVKVAVAYSANQMRKLTPMLLNTMVNTSSLKVT